MTRFSINYSAATQARCLELIENGELEEALYQIEQLPPARTTDEALQRGVVIIEAYRMITNKYQDLVDNALSGPETDDTLGEEPSQNDSNLPPGLADRYNGLF